MNQHGLDEMNLLAILLITIIIIIFLAWMVKYKANAKERLLVIEKDYDLKKIPEKKNASFPLIKMGIILTAGCIGFFIGGIIETFISTVNSTSELAEFSALGSKTIFSGKGTLSLLLMYLFAGVGMIFSEKIAKGKH